MKISIVWSSHYLLPITLHTFNYLFLYPLYFPCLILVQFLVLYVFLYYYLFAVLSWYRFFIIYHIAVCTLILISLHYNFMLYLLSKSNVFTSFLQCLKCWHTPIFANYVFIPLQIMCLWGNGKCPSYHHFILVLK